MIVSCETSGNFHGKNIQKDRFARCFRQFSQKKHPKGSFRAMLPTIFTEKASKRTESLKWKKIPQKNGKKFPEKFWTRLKRSIKSSALPPTSSPIAAISQFALDFDVEMTPKKLPKPCALYGLPSATGPGALAQFLYWCLCTSTFCWGYKGRSGDTGPCVLVYLAWSVDASSIL